MISTIRKIHVGSAFSIGAIVYAILAAVFGLCGLVFQGAFLALVLGSSSSYNSGNAAALNSVSALGIGSLCISYLIGVAVFAVFGGVFGALTAFIYNLAARWVGGLKVELDRADSDPYDPDNWVVDDLKPKRRPPEETGF